jgi:hypothetical protein
LAPYIHEQDEHSRKEKDIFQAVVDNGGDAGGRLVQGSQSTDVEMELASLESSELLQPSQFVQSTTSPTVGKKRLLTESDESSSTGAKRRTAGFCCPYRIRNPRRFNVREHHACATQVWADLTQLK